MAEAKERRQWNHTSAVLAMLANVNRDPKKGRAFRPDDFNPYADKKSGGGVKIDRRNIGLLKKAFLKQRNARSAE